MILGNILGMESFWNNFIKPVLPKRHYFLGAIAGALGGKLLGGGLMKGLLGKMGGGLMSKMGGAGLKGIMGKMGMGNFGSGTGFLSKIGKGAFGGGGGFMSGQGALSKIGGGGEGFMGNFGSGQGKLSQLYDMGEGKTAYDKFSNLQGNIGDIQQQISQFSPPNTQQMGRGGTSRDDYASAGTGITQFGPAQLNQVQQGGQWNYNAPQAGMRGLQNMPGLLGLYGGGRGYRR